MQTIHQQIRCAEIWGGISAVDQEVVTSSLAISIFSAPCEGQAGGDIYYVSVCGGDQLTRIAIADLQGHGPEVSPMSRRIYDSLLEHLGDLDNCAVLSEMNQFALDQEFEAMTTAVVVSYLLAEQSLSYTYAGHPPVLLKQRKGEPWRLMRFASATGLSNAALGIFPDVTFEQRTLLLQQGDRFCVYTDGVTECPDLEDQPFGENRLRELLSRYDDVPLGDAKAEILRELRTYSGETLAADDTTLLLVEVR